MKVSSISQATPAASRRAGVQGTSCCTGMAMIWGWGTLCNEGAAPIAL